MVTAVFEHLLDKYPGRISIETLTPVESVTEVPTDAFPYKIQTNRGTIEAKHVVYCTNAHTGSLLPSLRSKIFPLRGHMTVQIPGDKFAHVGAERSWSITYGGHGIDYITQNPKTDEIYIGGGFTRGRDDGIFDVGNTDDSSSDRLTRAHLHGILPVAFGSENWGKDSSLGPRVKAEWTGIMGFTADGLPLVGNLPKFTTGRDGNGEWIAAGFNGYGMVNCWLSGKAVAHQILGKNVDWFPEQFGVSSERLLAMKDEDVVRGFLGSL